MQTNTQTNVAVTISVRDNNTTYEVGVLLVPDNLQNKQEYNLQELWAEWRAAHPQADVNTFIEWLVENKGFKYFDGIDHVTVGLYT